VTTSAMASEIGESADVVAKIIRNCPATHEIAHRIGIGSTPLCVVCGRGSSGHAGVFLKYLVETRLRLPVSASAPSVITAFRTPLMLRHALFIVISQSGRSPDLVAATKSARDAGARTIAIVNATSSPVADEAEFVVPIEAGQEHSVAATKTVIGSMAAGPDLLPSWRKIKGCGQPSIGCPTACTERWHSTGPKLPMISPRRQPYLWRRGALAWARPGRSRSNFRKSCACPPLG